MKGPVLMTTAVFDSKRERKASLTAVRDFNWNSCRVLKRIDLVAQSLQYLVVPTIHMSESFLSFQGFDLPLPAAEDSVRIIRTNTK